MTTFETTTTIGKDRVLNLKLPNTIIPGDAHIVVIIEENIPERKITASMDRFLSNCQDNHLGLNDQITWNRDELYR
ncbi:MAG: hypothetical protein HQM14_21320 [SAR324 cluster bacterium]|nr:hypothetical protein [SAR324 cluster bacterium]